MEKSILLLLFIILICDAQTIIQSEIPLDHDPRCITTTYTNGYVKTYCHTENTAYQPGCATGDDSRYCFYLQVDSCVQDYDPGFGNIPNVGNEPDGVTRTCENHRTGGGHVACCRTREPNNAVQCTALRDPNGGRNKTNCITPGAEKVLNNDGSVYYDSLGRNTRIFYQDPLNNKERPMKDTTASWDYANEVCENLEGGTEGWRLCYDEEVLSGACCQEESGLHVCDFQDADMWVKNVCDSDTTCGVVSEWQVVKGTNRGNSISTTAQQIYCVLNEGSTYTSSRNHLCEWVSTNPPNQQCVPKPNVKIANDNTGDRGYNFFLTESQLLTFPHTVEDSEFVIDPVYNYTSVLAFTTPEEADAFGACAEDLNHLDYCAYEVTKFKVETNMKLYNTTANTVLFPDEDQGDTPGSRRRRLQLTTSSLDVEKSWSAPDVFVVVVDTGVRSTHDAFQDRVLPGYDAFEKTSVAAGTEDPFDGHGTHVAGTAAGNLLYKGKNIGINRNAKIIPVTVFNSYGDATLTALKKGLTWILEKIRGNPSGRYVINISLCAPGEATRGDFAQLFNNINKAGAIVVVAACNWGGMVTDHMFGNYDNTFTVSSNTYDNPPKLSSFAGWDSYVDVHGEGEDVVSACYSADNELSSLSGTSMAAPYIAGVLSKLWEIYPDYTASSVINHFLTNCVEDTVLEYHPQHLKRPRAPDEINPAHVDVERANCLAGVIVPCFGDSYTCSVPGLASYYNVPESQVEEIDSVLAPLSTASVAAGVTKNFRITTASASQAQAIVQSIPQPPTTAPTTPPPTTPKPTSAPTAPTTQRPTTTDESTDTYVGIAAASAGALCLFAAILLYTTVKMRAVTVESAGGAHKQLINCHRPLGL